MSGNGEKAVSFGYADWYLCVYDLKRKVLLSKNEMLRMVSDYCFDFDATKSLIAFENSSIVHYWNHLAPTHRRKEELD
jgi:hypothetical protein